MQRKTIQTGAPWEGVAHYSRAVRIGSTIEVAGTTAMNGDTIVGKGDVAAQTHYIFTLIERVLEELGASLQDVVRTRMYVTDIGDWEKIGTVHGAFFKGINPVATMVEVSSLIHPDLLIEIEVTAIALSKNN